MLIYCHVWLCLFKFPSSFFSFTFQDRSLHKLSLYVKQLSESHKLKKDKFICEAENSFFWAFHSFLSSRSYKHFLKVNIISSGLKASGDLKKTPKTAAKKTLYMLFCVGVDRAEPWPGAQIVLATMLSLAKSMWFVHADILDSWVPLSCKEKYIKIYVYL